VDFRLVALISVIPLGLALWGFSNRCAERACALRYATANIMGYFVFQSLVVLYFVLAATQA
jgi:1,4-dihydroxy-2-naphthoate octaprenyltransferase